MFHVAGTSNVFACTWVGARSVILPRFEPVAVLEAIDAHGITHGVFVPTMLAMLLEHATRHPRSAPPAVRGVADLTRAAAARARVAAGLRRRPVLRDDRGRADGHAPLARGPRLAAVVDGRARPGRAGRGARAAGRGGRAVGARAERDARLLEPARGHRAGARRRLVPHRRPRARGRGRLLLHGRPRQGHDHHRRRERVLGGGRGGAVQASGRGRGRGVRRPRRALGRGRARGRRRARRPGGADASIAAPPWPASRSRASIDVRDEPLPKSGAGKLLKHQLREPHWAGRDRLVG